MKTEVLRAVGIWVDSDRVSSLKNFSVMLYKGEVTGMLGLVGSGITVVADALSGRKKLEKGCIYKMCIRDRYRPGNRKQQ